MSQGAVPCQPGVNPGIFDPKQAEGYLQQCGLLDRARAEHCPAAHNDPGEVWGNYAINIANMVKWNGGKWGPDWTHISCRGQTLDMPGAYQSVWHPNGKQTMLVTEWPNGPHWLQCGEKFKATGQEFWWYDPKTTGGPI